METSRTPLLFAPLFALLHVPALHAEISITTTPVPDAFVAPPWPTTAGSPATDVVAEWTTASIGPATDTAITDAAGFDTKVIAAADASTITSALGSSSTIPPVANPIARFNTGASAGSVTFLQTRPIASDYLLLLAHLVNATGGPINQIKVAYDYSKATNIASENIKGHRVYLSLTGAPGSWRLIPVLSTDTAGTFDAPQAVAAIVDLPSALANGGTMFLLWADQNSTGADASYHIDNFAVTKSNTTILTPVVTNLQRNAGANPTDISDDTLSFDLTVAINPPAGTPGWTTTGTAFNPPVTGTYGSTVHVTGFPVSLLPATVDLADRLDPTSTASFTLSGATLPKYIALNTISGSPAYVQLDATSASQWVSNGAAMNIIQNNGGGTTPWLASTAPIPFAPSTVKCVTLTMDAEDTSAGTNFEFEDQLKIELVTDAGTQNLTSFLDANGNGFINGYSMDDAAVPPRPDIYDSIPRADEFNRDGILIAGFFNNTWLVHGIIPANATTAHLVISGNNNSATETYRIRDVRFAVCVDTDKDGAFDSEEAVDGTDPNDKNSVFREVSHSYGGANVSVTVPTVATRDYQLLSSSDLLTWIFEGIPMAGTGANITLTTPATPRRKFVRVITQQ